MLLPDSFEEYGVTWIRNKIEGKPHNQLWTWVACPDCGKGRWIARTHFLARYKAGTYTGRCCKCSNKNNSRPRAPTQVCEVCGETKSKTRQYFAQIIEAYTVVGFKMICRECEKKAVKTKAQKREDDMFRIISDERFDSNLDAIGTFIGKQFTLYAEIEEYFSDEVA